MTVFYLRIVQDHLPTVIQQQVSRQISLMSITFCIIVANCNNWSPLISADKECSIQLFIAYIISFNSLSPYFMIFMQGKYSTKVVLQTAL